MKEKGEMEIIRAEGGCYLRIHMAGVGFAESVWYENKEDLVRAVIENNVVWKTLFPPLEIRSWG